MENEMFQQNDVIKEDILHHLTEMREEIQSQLFDMDRPERNFFIQRANFIYALISKIQEEYKTPDNIVDFINELESHYPLATQTIEEIKSMPYWQNNAHK